MTRATSVRMAESSSVVVIGRKSGWPRQPTPVCRREGPGPARSGCEPGREQHDHHHADHQHQQPLDQAGVTPPGLGGVRGSHPPCARCGCRPSLATDQAHPRARLEVVGGRIPRRGARRGPRGALKRRSASSARCARPPRRSGPCRGCCRCAPPVARDADLDLHLERLAGAAFPTRRSPTQASTRNSRMKIVSMGAYCRVCP